jgi:hypothetical protein
MTDRGKTMPKKGKTVPKKGKTVPDKKQNDPLIDALIELEKDQKKALLRCTEEPETPPVEVDDCCLCGSQSYILSYSRDEAARDLYDCGWRVFSSEEYQTTGLMCPKCIGKEVTRRLGGGE